MNYLLIARKKLENILGTSHSKLGSDISVKSDKRGTETHFTKTTDPYKKAGGKNFWKMHVPPEMRPQWVKEVYGL